MKTRDARSCSRGTLLETKTNADFKRHHQHASLHAQAVFTMKISPSASYIYSQGIDTTVQYVIVYIVTRSGSFSSIRPTGSESCLVHPMNEMGRKRWTKLGDERIRKATWVMTSNFQRLTLSAWRTKGQ